MRRYLILLLLVVLALALLIGCGRRKSAEAAEDANTADPEANVSLALSDENVKFLKYCDGRITVRFSQDETGTWRWVDEPTFPLNGEKVEELLAALAELAPIHTFTPESLDDYGLDEPQRYVSMNSDLVEDTMFIGNQAEDGTWYMMMAGQEQVHTIPDQFVQLLSRSVYDMAVLPTLPLFTEENLINVAVDGENGRAFMRKVDGVWKGISQQVTTRADKTVAALGTLQLSRCFDFLPSDKALSLTGFNAPTAVITVEYLNSVNVENTFTLTLGALRSSEEGYYATINDDSTIYLIPAAQVSPLLVLQLYAS